MTEIPSDKKTSSLVKLKVVIDWDVAALKVISVIIGAASSVVGEYICEKLEKKPLSSVEDLKDDVRR